MGSRAVRRSPRLAWDALITLFGSEETLRDRIEALRASDVQLADDLAELIDKYRSGWRPKDFGPDDE